MEFQIGCKRCNCFCCILSPFLRLFIHALTEQVHLFYDAFVNAALIGDKAIFCTATKSVLNNCNTHKTENGRSSSGAINPSTSPHNLIQDSRVMQKFFVSILGQKIKKHERRYVSILLFKHMIYSSFCTSQTASVNNKE